MDQDSTESQIYPSSVSEATPPTVKKELANMRDNLIPKGFQRKMLRKSPFTILALILFIIFVAFLYSRYSNRIGLPSLPDIPGIGSSQDTDFGFEKFASENEFTDYLNKVASSELGSSGQFRSDIVLEQSPSTGIEAPSLDMGVDLSTPSFPDRVSGTNVQVQGIDEPDIVKTDGNNIFFSSNFFGLDEPIILDTVEPSQTTILPPNGIPPRPVPVSETKIISAFPPSNLSEISSVEERGELLYANNKLIVFSGSVIKAYDVASAANPVESWELELDNRNSVVTSRLTNNKIYIVTQSSLNRGRPCPLRLTPEDSPRAITVPCSDIYHPIRPISIDSTYTVFTLDPENGEVEDKITFTAPRGSTVVYMSPESIYVAYAYSESLVDFMINFVTEGATDIFPQDVIDRLEELQSYDISDSSKMMEVMAALEGYTDSLDEDEEKKITNDLENRMTSYVREHSRDLEKTGLVRIGVNGLDIEATGGVPGSVLNQFSLDEHEDHLRIATTTGRNSFFSGNQSFNDVYVLNSRLQEVGRVEDLGLTERIFSARFIGDRGYIVTFRQIDPFYVIDLSDPKNPRMTGELKIPGFSSYLHELATNKILGVGRDGSRVKVSLFDVSSPNNPVEVSIYLLNEGWSDIQNTHHAFLQDRDLGIFFLPGSTGGYIFGYEGDSLELVKAVSDIRARRALFINNYLYVVGDDKVVVLNEADWERVNELEF